MEDIRQTHEICLRLFKGYRLFIFHGQESPVFNDKIQADNFLIKLFSLYAADNVSFISGAGINTSATEIPQQYSGCWIC